MLDVACALILDKNTIFAAQRAAHKSNPHLWEFPGGKIEPGEDAPAAIIREMKEELNLHVLPLQPFEHKTVTSGSVCLHPWYCSIQSGKLVLRDHQRYQWVALQQWKELLWTPPDVTLLELLTGE